MSKKCGPGKILRKGYRRNEYTRRNGTSVSASYVPSTCVPDFGNVGKGRKTLPALDDRIHLRNFGYSIHRPVNSRRRALRDASREYGVRAVLMRLNLERNYQAIPENKAIFTDDVEYMKDLYDPYRKSNSRTAKYDVWRNSNERERIRNPNNRPRSQKGGVMTSRKYKQVYKCRNGVCANYSSIHEVHRVNGREILFYTIDSEDDEDDFTEFNNHLGISNFDVDNEFVIGLQIDDKLRGYCRYFYRNKTVHITRFVVTKGYGVTLYTFLEKYFRLEGYDDIVVDVNTNDERLTRNAEFWRTLGFANHEGETMLKHIKLNK